MYCICSRSDPENDRTSELEGRSEKKEKKNDSESSLGTSIHKMVRKSNICLLLSSRRREEGIFEKANSYFINGNLQTF